MRVAVIVCRRFDMESVLCGALIAHTISEPSDGNCRFCPMPPIIKISNPLSLQQWDYYHQNLLLVR